MSALRKVELSETGDGQVVRIPLDLRLPGKEATIRREGDRIILQAAVTPADQNRKLADFLATLDPIDEDFGPIDDLPADPVDL